MSVLSILQIEFSMYLNLQLPETNLSFQFHIFLRSLAKGFAEFFKLCQTWTPLASNVWTNPTWTSAAGCLSLTASPFSSPRSHHSTLAPAHATLSELKTASFCCSRRFHSPSMICLQTPQRRTGAGQRRSETGSELLSVIRDGGT